MSSMTGFKNQSTGNQQTMSGQSNVPKGYREASVQQFSPEQIDFFKSLFKHFGEGSYLSKLAGGDESLFGEMEAPALKQFSGLQGNIASRFSGMGSGARRSSGFQNTMTSASQDFASQLQSQRQSLQQNAIKDLMGLGGQLLGQRPYENALVEKPMSFLKQMGVGVAEGIPAAAAAFLL